MVAMLACARIGAVHGLLPASLPADALADRLSDLGPKVLVTQDGAFRHGLIVPSKSRADEALAAAAGVEATVVVRRIGVDVAWYEGDRWYHDLVAAPRPGARRAPAAGAGEPSRYRPTILCSSSPWPIAGAGRRGSCTAPAATSWPPPPSTAGPSPPGPTTWCGARPRSPGSAARPTACTGPWPVGATVVMSEGTLDVPRRSRAWEITERYGVNALGDHPVGGP